MGKLMMSFVFVNCPGVKKQPSRFTIDNNFFPSTCRAARYLNVSESESVDVLATTHDLNRFSNHYYLTTFLSRSIHFDLLTL